MPSRWQLMTDTWQTGDWRLYWFAVATFSSFAHPFCSLLSRPIFNFGALSSIHVFVLLFLFWERGLGQPFGIFPLHERLANEVLGHYLLIALIAWGVLFKWDSSVSMYLLIAYEVRPFSVSFLRTFRYKRDIEGEVDNGISIFRLLMG